MNSAWLAAPLLLALPGAAPEDPVRAGRRSLDHWWRYPWYDASGDSVRRIDVREPYSWDWLANWLEGLDFSWLQRLFRWGGQALSWPSTLFGWLAWAAILVLFVVIVWLLYRAWRRRWRGEEQEGEEGDDRAAEEDRYRVEALPFPVQRRRGDLLDEARLAYEQGHFGQAAIYLFSYQLVALDKHHRIHLTKGKTNRQYLREVGRRSGLGRIVEATMVAFEDVFFGNRSLDRDRFERCWAELPQFQRLLTEAEA